MAAPRFPFYRVINDGFIFPKATSFEKKKPRVFGFWAFLEKIVAFRGFFLVRFWVRFQICFYARSDGESNDIVGVNQKNEIHNKHGLITKNAKTPLFRTLWRFSKILNISPAFKYKNAKI